MSTSTARGRGKQGGIIPIWNRRALAAALQRLVTDYGSQSAAAARLKIERSGLVRLLRGERSGVRPAMLRRLEEVLTRKEIQGSFVPDDWASRLREYGQYLERELGRYGLMCGLPGDLTAWLGRGPSVPRLPAWLVAVYPEWDAAPGQSADVEIVAFNALGGGILTVVKSLDGDPEARLHLRHLRTTLARRWARNSAEFVAVRLLVLARVLAPLLPASGRELKAQLDSLDDPDVGRVYLPDTSGVSLSLEEIQRAHQLGPYLRAAFRAELIRLERPSALIRVSGGRAGGRTPRTS